VRCSMDEAKQAAEKHKEWWDNALRTADQCPHREELLWAHCESFGVGYAEGQKALEARTLKMLEEAAARGMLAERERCYGLVNCGSDSVDVLDAILNPREPE
jgi:hypothetical protein